MYLSQAVDVQDTLAALRGALRPLQPDSDGAGLRAQAGGAGRLPVPRGAETQQRRGQDEVLSTTNRTDSGDGQCEAPPCMNRGMIWFTNCP